MSFLARNPWGGPATGALLLLLALARHRSEAPIVLGQWSLAYGAFLGGVTLAVALLVVTALHRERRERSEHRASPLGRSQRAGRFLGGAALALGAAHFAQAWWDPQSATRILDANIVGGVHPLVAVLEWFALAALLVAGLVMLPGLAPRFLNLALMTGALGFSLVTLEGCARGQAVLRPQIEGFPTHRARMWEGRFVALNEYGFRDRDRALSAGVGSRRLLIVGDSYAFGLGLNRAEDRAGELLAVGVSDQTGEPWEAMIVASPGTHTLHHLEFLQHGLRYQPDLVLLLYVFNDMDYLAEALPRSVLADHPRSFLDRLHPVRFAFLNSFAFQAAYVRARHVALPWRPREEDTLLRADPYADPELVAIHLQHLAAFVAQAHAAGVRTYIVPFDVAVATSHRARERYSEFADALAGAGLPFLRADSVFQAEPYRALTVNRLDRHPSAYANELLARVLLEKITVPDRPGPGESFAGDTP